MYYINLLNYSIRQIDELCKCHGFSFAETDEMPDSSLPAEKSRLEAFPDSSIEDLATRFKFSDACPIENVCEILIARVAKHRCENSAQLKKAMAERKISI